MGLRETRFDPEDDKHYGDPLPSLTLAIRSLPLGARVALPDGTLVISRAVKGKAHHKRTFTVVPPLERSTPAERHKAVAMGHGDCRTAEQAAARALNKASADVSS